MADHHTWPPPHRCKPEVIEYASWDAMWDLEGPPTEYEEYVVCSICGKPMPRDPQPARLSGEP